MVWYGTDYLPRNIEMAEVLAKDYSLYLAQVVEKLRHRTLQVHTRKWTGKVMAGNMLVIV